MAMSVPLTVKWGKESYDVEADTTQPPAVFKFQLYSLTGVPPDRQKIMIKGGFLKDDSDWAKVALKKGQKLMMMGTADKVFVKSQTSQSNLVWKDSLKGNIKTPSGEL